MTNKKLLSIAIAGILLLAAVSPVFADDEPTPTVVPTATTTITPTVTPGPRGWGRFFAGRGQLLKTIRTDNQDARVTITQNRRDMRLKNAEATFQAIENNLTARFNFLTDVKTKIQAKLTQAQSSGKDVTAAQNELNTFNPARYQTDYAALQSEYQVLLGSTTPSTVVPALRTDVNTVRTDIVNLRQILVQTLRLLIRLK